MSRQRMPSQRALVGRKIIAYDPGAYDNQRGGTAWAPTLLLDDGTELSFRVDETDCGDQVYSVFIKRRKLATGKK
jgi:hypothetical protein